LFSLLDAGFLISFGAGLLKDAGNLEPFFSRIPADRLFFETDDDPSTDIRAIYALAASMRGVPVDELCATVQANFRRIFQ
jgi:Tat protein secretion system quality control protein TatD with DNase activity